jgi:hypothetical protein
VGGLAGWRANGVAMQDLTAKRTLVKSPPELWEELSEVERLARHLGAFGEITITKLEPEQTVAWEGEHASGTVSIEPSGWGTKVVLTAELAAIVDPPDREDEGPSEPVAALAFDAAGAPAMAATEDAPTGRPRRRRGFWARLFQGWLVPEERLNPAAEPPDEATAAGVVAAETPEPEEVEPAEAPPSAIDSDDARAVLEATLDALGSAHHRPYSRS